jgi:AcrR family transcriptional regulator
VAERAGLTPAAPAYHFRTIEELLSAAEMSLIAQSKDRYRNVMRNVDRTALSLDQLIDMTTTVFIREATEFGSVNLAFFGNWIEASRRPELRVTVWTFIRDIHAGWQRLFDAVAGRPLPMDIGMIAFALFLGKLIRALSTGSDITDLAEVRGEFADDFSRLRAGNFWALSDRAA